MASSYNALKLYKHLDNGTSVPFPDANSQIELLDWQYDAKRMGGAPLITATIKYPTCLDDLWGYGLVYVTYKGEEYILKQTPTSSYSNEEIVYKHEVEFISERYVLDNVYFYDVVSQTHPDYKPVTNSTKFSFFGDINEFVSRLNASFTYSNVGYSVVVDDDVVSDALLVSFEDKYMSEVLQEGYKNYGIPFYFVGKVVHYGYTSNVITHPIKYGVDQALLSIQKTNANTKVVTRITGVGSADNIPYWYPNDYESKEEVESHGGTWIEPQANLMPPIYRESLGAQRFYNALNNTYPNPSGGYYTFTNPYVSGRQREWKEDFEDIKPTINGMTNANGQRIDMFSAFAYDLNDSDEVDADGNYLHPYFFAKLRRMDGTYGFNLFDHSIDEEEMTIAITGGTLGACEFVIGVDEESQKNPVQVDENGNLVRDANGNVVYTGVPQERQNDTQNYEVWVALRKDINTFGVIMPNATNNYKPDVSDTTFVILHIDLPKAYILAAEDRLKDALIRYMVGANNEHWNFSIGFSRIFFEENPSVLSELNENARVQVEYNNHTYELYISSYTYKKDGNVPLPQITVELAEELSISENPIQQAIDGVRSDILNNIGGSADFLKLGLRYFLRKDVDDIARGKITFTKGLQVGNRFTSGLLGEGGVFRKDADDKTYIEADKLYIRMKAYFDTVEIRKYLHSAGNRIASPAGAKCIRVEPIGIFQNQKVVTDENGVYHYKDANNQDRTAQLTIVSYRCYFRGEEDDIKVTNDFVIGDQAFCNVTNVTGTSSLTQKRYWRLIIDRNTEGTLTDNGEYWIELSNKTTEVLTIDGTSYTHAGYEANSDVPAAQDDIVQLGNIYDIDRQGAIIEYVSGADSPSYQIYQGINDFSLVGKNQIALGYSTQTGRAYLNVYGDTFIGDRNGTTYVSYDASAKKLNIKAVISAQSPISDNGTEVSLSQYIKNNTWTQQQINTLITDSTSQQFADIDAALQTLQNQIDGNVTIWYGNGVPTMYDYPVTEWDDYASHEGDLYMDKDTNNAYRFLYDDQTQEYGWNLVQDSAITDALAMAMEARDLADGKRRIFVTQPNPPYDIGDLWVNATYSDGNVSYSNDILRCKTARSSGTFSISNWQLASNYIDEAYVTNWINSTYTPMMSTLQAQIDGKTETWRQNSDPAGNWSTNADKEKHVGDLWMDTTTNRGNKTYIYLNRGTSENPDYQWVAQDVPTEVFDKIDGKADIFVSKPTTYNVNDMWIIEEGLAVDDMPTGCKHKDIVISSAKRTNSYQKADWSKKDRYTDDTIVNDFVSKIVNGTAETTGNVNIAANAINAVTQALQKGNETTMAGGLILTTLIGMRDSQQNVWSGISGAYNSSLLGNGIAAWYGGGMKDYEALSEQEKAQGWDVQKWARGVDRFDGSGYRANANIRWTDDGKVYLSNLYTGNNTPISSLFFDAFAIGLDGTTSYINPTFTFSDIDIVRRSGNQYTITGTSVLNRNENDARYMVAERFFDLFDVYNGDTNYTATYKTSGLPQDTSNISIKAKFGFWTEKFISALGRNDDEGGSGGSTTLEGLNDVNISESVANGQVLTYQNGYWVNGTASGGSSAWADITGKPSTIAGYGITDAKIVNGVITLGANSITPITSHQSLANYVTYTAMTNALANYLPLTGGTLSGGLSTRTITPASNSSYSLGSNASRWRSIYTTDVYSTYFSFHDGGYLQEESSDLMWHKGNGSYTVIHSGNIDDYATNISLSTTGSGNAFTSATFSNGTLTLTKGSTFATQSWVNTQLGSYLPLSGGTMTGKLKWNNSSALSRATSTLFVLCIDAFADGGETHYIQNSDLSVGSATKATQDGAGNTITSKYVTLDTTQTISGTKTFSTTVRLNGYGIEDVGGAGLLIYHPIGSWTGISSSQWGVGSIDSQGVIRSGNQDLEHYRYTGNASTSYRWSIIDTYNLLSNLVYDTNFSNNAPCAKLVTIKITSTYRNEGINFSIVGRGSSTPCHVSIKFSNSSSSDPSLETFCYEGNPTYGVLLHLYKTATSTWEVWTSNQQTYDRTYVYNVTARQGITITPHRSAYASALPSSPLASYSCSPTVAYSTYINFRNTADSNNAGYCGRGSTANNDIALMAYSGNKLLLGANGTTMMTLDGTNVGIGTTSPSYKLHVAGTIYATGGVTALSDMRFKQVIRPIDVSVEQIAKLPTFDFLWKEGEDSDEHTGTSAQAMQCVLPNLVHGSEQLNIEYGVAGTIIGILNSRKLVSHEDRIKALEKENKVIRQENEELRQRIKTLEEAA